MRYRFLFLVVPLLMFSLLSCHRRAQKNSTSTPQYSIRIENDSLFVDGAIRDAKTFGIPLSYQVDPPAKYDDNDDEQFRLDRLKNPRRVCLQFSEKINGYDVQVTLHPDEDNDDVGMAEWVFSKDRKKLRINTGFYWDWGEDIKGQIKDSIRYEGETYSLFFTGGTVQGRDSIIHNTPFCFKDVDYDGKSELCFREPGYNRYYYNIFKIISPTKAEMMTGQPYNNIVYTDYPEHVNTSTLFDYEKKTIDVSESLGCGDWIGQLFRRRDVVGDVLDPMEFISGQELEYTASYHEFKYYENGKWVRTEYSYFLDYPSDYAVCNMDAEYVTVDERTFVLQTLQLHDCDNEIWQVLFSLIKDPIGFDTEVFTSNSGKSTTKYYAIFKGQYYDTSETSYKRYNDAIRLGEKPKVALVANDKKTYYIIIVL